jgi:hypothetical protein
LYSSPNIIRIIEGEMGKAYSTNGDKRIACRILVGKPEGKISLEKQRRRLWDNIKVDLLSC